MKKYIIGALTCLCIVLLLGADVDLRNAEPNSKKVWKYEAATVTHSSGETAAETTTELINGVVRQITVAVSDNTANVTATVALSDEDGAVLWTEAGIAENGISVFQYNTRSSTDLPMSLYCAGTMTLTVTPSGDPCSGGMTTDVVLYGD